MIVLHIPDDYSPGFTLQILISNGDGSFTDETATRLPTQHTLQARGVKKLWAVDLEGDGDTDLVEVSWGQDWEPDNDVLAFYMNQGDGTFRAMPAGQLPPVHPLATPVDLNGDHKMDFVFLEYPGLAVTVAQ